MLNEVPLISWSEIHDWNGRVPTSMATSYCMNIYHFELQFATETIQY